MKKNIILALSITGAILLIGSFPLKTIAGSMASDICRIVGFVLVFVVLGRKRLIIGTLPRPLTL